MKKFQATQKEISSRIYRNKVSDYAGKYVSEEIEDLPQEIQNRIK